MNRKYILPFLLLIQIILLQIISYFPEIIERFYSNGLYLWISNFSRILFGWIPFSLGDILYTLLIIWIIKWLYQNRKMNWKQKTIAALSFFSVFYFSFHLLWALNYHREPLFEKMNIEKDYTDAELLVFTKKLIAKTNQLQLQITKDKNQKVAFPYSQEQVFEMNLNGYQNLSKQHSFISYKNPSIKKSLLSTPLSYMGFSGYLNPFTNEAQVNNLGPMFGFPMTTNHEMAHQLGYASESEANFIGFLASIKNDDVYIQYSGYSAGLRYCLNNWGIRNEKTFYELRKTIHPGILKNYKENKDFWKSYESFIETGFHIFYDNFLKMNQQKDGLESYSKFVNLMVGYYKEKGF
ncbi:MAG: DUF3810 domain-containing protein [Bacteroidota bacterium]